MAEIRSNSTGDNAPLTTETANWRWLASCLDGLGPLLALFGVILLFAILDHRKEGFDTFFTVANMRMLIVQTVTVAVAALGMTLIIISGGIDLSAGTSVALCSVVLALGLKQNWSPALAVAACITMGGVLGAVNGLLISGLSIPPFIATLGTMTAFLGVAKILAEETTVRPRIEQIPSWLEDLVSPTAPWRTGDKWSDAAPDLLFNHPVGVWVGIILAVAMMVVLRYTVLGRHIFAMGSNEATARLCGVPVRRTRVVIYALAGLLVGAAGVLQFARLSAGSPKDGVGMELRIIAAVVIGGASLNGGRGTILGTLTGAAIMNVIVSGCTTLNLSNSIQDIVIGSIIVGAVTLDQWRQRRSEQ